MAHFSAAVVTKAGIDLALNGVTGVQSIEFVKIVSGNGEYTEDEKSRDALRERSALKNQMQEFPFNCVEITSEKTAVLKGIITNKSLAQGYRITEIGIYARAKGTEGDGILYSLALAVEADYLPSYVNPTEIIQEYYVTVSDSAEISIVANPGAYALAEDLEKLKKDIEYTGLFGSSGENEGIRTDVLINIQRDVSGLKNPIFEEVKIRENINSGEPYDILFGKIEKWLSDLKSAAFASIADNCTTTEEGHVLDARQGTALQGQVDEIKGSIDELKKSVADGKALIAAAITRKGITTASDADFETIAANIARIVVSTDVVHSVYATCTYNGKATNQMVMTLYKDGQPLGSKNYTSSAYGTYYTNTYSV